MMNDFFYKKAKELGGIPNINVDTAKFRDTLKQLGVQIPDYIFELLSKHGGLYFNNDIEVTNVVSVPIASKGKIGIGQFLDISDYESVVNIMKEVPNNVFPVLEGAAGDYIVIGISHSNFGKIYYWYHEANYDEDLFFIFENFREFIENLEIDNKDEDDSREVISFSFDF